MFHVLRRGHVKFTQISAEGHEVILRIIGPGEPFGGVAAFADNAIYPVTARAVDAADAYAWDGRKMLGLTLRFPEVAINGARMIAERLHALQRQHRELMTERVERRIARALLRFVQGAGRHVDAVVAIEFPLSRHLFPFQTLHARDKRVVIQTKPRSSSPPFLLPTPWSPRQTLTDATGLKACSFKVARTVT